MNDLINVGIIIGGRSVECEISLISGSQAYLNIDNTKYNKIIFYLDKNNKMYIGKCLENIDTFITNKFTDLEEVALINNTEIDAKLVALKAAANAASTADSDDTDEPTLEEASAQGFTVYKPEGGNYYAYYYYVNRHNDNDNPEVMEAMEFAVVRNNVYKLSVSNIFQYGHPGDPLGDPDPLYPSTPDEEKNVYFKVTVQVLPWVVRTNNIEF